MWEDTVMEGEALEDLVAMDNAAGVMDGQGRQGSAKRETMLLKNQAEITGDIAFKKGRESFLDDFGNATIPLSEAHQRGIKKVVDWVEEESNKGYIYEGTYAYDTSCDNQIFTDLGDWQAKLKDWRIRGVNR